MEKGPPRLLRFIALLTTLGFLLSWPSGCQRAPAPAPPAAGVSEHLRGFSFEHFSPAGTMTLTAESAEFGADKKNGSLERPGLAIRSTDSVIEITTGPGATAKMSFGQNREEILSILMEGTIRIVQKDIKSGAVQMEARCGKLTYRGQNSTLMLEKNPVVTRGTNTFSGDTITYFVKDQSLEMEGKINGVIAPDNSIAP